MKSLVPEHALPEHGVVAQGLPPVVCYPVAGLPPVDLGAYRAARSGWSLVRSVTVPPREARCFEVAAGEFFRISSIDGPQVGDLNLWNSNDITERFFSGKTRALHGTHLSTGDRMWSNLPHMRAMATITEDTLDWYGFDAFGGSVHDVIGTRCDPYTHNLLSGGQYHAHAIRPPAPECPTGRPTPVTGWNGSSDDTARRSEDSGCKDRSACRSRHAPTRQSGQTHTSPACPQ